MVKETSASTLTSRGGRMWEGSVSFMPVTMQDSVAILLIEVMKVYLVVVMIITLRQQYCLTQLPVPDT